MAIDNESRLLGSTADAHMREDIAGTLRKTPALAAMLERMKPEDAERVGRIISDPAAARRLLESPQAKKLLEAMRGGGK